MIYVYRYEEAISLCRKLLVANSCLVDIWLCVAELYSLVDDCDATRQVSILPIVSSSKFQQLKYCRTHNIQLIFLSASHNYIKGKL